MIKKGWKHLLILLSSFIVLLALPFVGARVDSLQYGISGLITAKPVISELKAGEASFLIGTSNGLYILSDKGDLKNYIHTDSVTNIAEIGDINENGEKDIIISTENIYFPNLRVYDSKTKELLWEFSPSVEVFDSQLLWTDKQTSVFDLKIVKDVDSDSHNEVIISSGYNLYMISGKTGKELWRFESKNNIWRIITIKDIDGDKINDIAAGNQDGYLYLVSGKNGSLIFGERIIEEYEVIDPNLNKGIGNVARAVWDIVPHSDEKEKLIISAEDGFVYSFDLESRSIEWRTKIIEYVDMYLYRYYGDYPKPSTSLDRNFFNIRLQGVEAENNNNKIIALSYLGPQKQGREYQVATQAVYLLDCKNGKVVWDLQNIGLDYAKNVEIAKIWQKQMMAIPAGKSGNLEKIKIVDLESGDIYQTVSLNSTPLAGEKNGYYAKDFNGLNFLLVSDYGDVLFNYYSGTTIWNFPRMSNFFVEKADLTGDSTDDLFIASKDFAETDNILDNGKSKIFFVVDGSEKEIKWKYEMDYKKFVLTQGLNDVKVINDMNGDGKKEIIASMQYPEQEDEFGNKSRILIFSGKDGNILASFSPTKALYTDIYDEINRSPRSFEDIALREMGKTKSELEKMSPESQARIYSQIDRKKEEIFQSFEQRRIRKRIVSVDVFQDLNSDGINDIIVSIPGTVFITDGKNGNELLKKTYRSWEYQNPFTGKIDSAINWQWLTEFMEDDMLVYRTINDLNSDGIKDLIVAGHKKILVMQSNKTSYGLNFTFYISFTATRDLDSKSVKVIGDVDGDGFEELIYKEYVQDSPDLYVVVSPKKGIILFKVERRGTNLISGTTDYNNDNYKESIVFYKWTEGGPRLEVLGKNEWEWNYKEYKETWMLESFFGYKDFKPAVFIQDMNNDSINDIVLARTEPWQSGAELLIYDIAKNKMIKKISLEEINPTERQENRPQPSIATAQIPDLNNDGYKEIGVIGAFGERNKKEIKFVIVDIINNDLLSDFSIKGREITSVGNLPVLIGLDADIHFITGGERVKIIEPSGEKAKSPLLLKWNTSERAINIIFVDNNKIAQTFDNNITLDIPEGKHKISVYSLNSEGEGTYDNISLNVSKSHKSVWLSIAALIVLFSFLFFDYVIKLRDRIYEKWLG